MSVNQNLSLNTEDTQKGSQLKKGGVRFISLWQKNLNRKVIWKYKKVVGIVYIIWSVFTYRVHTNPNAQHFRMWVDLYMGSFKHYNVRVHAIYLNGVLTRK